MNELIKLMFDRRAYSAKFLQEMNNPKHGLLKDIDVFVTYLHSAKDKEITQITDFDLDGIASGVVGFSGLSELGFHINLLTPDSTEGYGFNEKVIDRMLREYPNTQVIITSDNGISCEKGIAYAKQLGLMVLVTDHHKQDKGIIVQADCIVDPMRLDETYDHPAICGAYVLQQCLQHYANIYCDSFMQEQIYRLGVFAGLGTLSDSMPVLYENRDVIRRLLDFCDLLYTDKTDVLLQAMPGCEQYKRSFYGLKRLLEVLKPTVKGTFNIDEMLFGFYAIPMFNSCKRLDAPLTLAFGVFFDVDPTSSLLALQRLNDERKNLVVKYLDLIDKTPQPFAPFIYFSEASHGILGLLASKLMEISGQTTLVVNPSKPTSIGMEHYGSGRSPDWYPFIDQMDLFRQSYPQFYVGGHNPAFGCHFTEQDLSPFYQYLSTDFNRLYTELGIANKSDIDLIISTCGDGDVCLDVGMIEEYLEEIQQYKPFGKGFPEPKILLKFTSRDITNWQELSQGKHLKVTFWNKFDILLWFQGDLSVYSALQHLDTSTFTFVVSGKLGINEFRGTTTLNFQGKIKDVIETKL